MINAIFGAFVQCKWRMLSRRNQQKRGPSINPLKLGSWKVTPKQLSSSNSIMMGSFASLEG